MTTGKTVRSWAAFDRHVRYADRKLLSRMPDFNDAVLVAGCQRSGTTAVTRILRDALGASYPTPTRDDELDAALILAGDEPFRTDDRCCFQTTYLNDHYAEYFDHDNYRLVWIIRQPDAVVRSMLHNWSRGALARLFRACGQKLLDERDAARYQRWGSLAVGRLKMACMSYAVKTAQIHELAERLGKERLFVCDYDDLIEYRDELLPRLFAFADIEFDPAYLQRFSKRRKKGRAEFSAADRQLIDQICGAEYERARAYQRRSATPGEEAG